MRLVNHEIHHIDHWSLLPDYRIVCETQVVIFGRRNAY
jgi:lipopolysaccharide/colanic/teichoic acid biosynthesis glycosyltransferase